MVLVLFWSSTKQKPSLFSMSSPYLRTYTTINILIENEQFIWSRYYTVQTTPAILGKIDSTKLTIGIANNDIPKTKDVTNDIIEFCRRKLKKKKSLQR
jgi:hypothetical protein